MQTGSGTDASDRSSSGATARRAESHGNTARTGTADRDATAVETPAARRRVTRERLRRIGRSATFRRIADLSAFDDLDVVRPSAHGRYADAIRVKATRDGRARGVALGLLDRPDDRSGYADDVADRLARWEGASDDAGVVTLHDWARDPRPWLATAPAERTLSSWVAPDVETRLRNAVVLAATVARLHGRGVVHAGIDPDNVVFPADTLAERPRPLLDNVGLMLALRSYFEPSNYLDPRYAAPEYYDDGFGGIDAATDVYQLGAVVYHCCTDRAPFRGSYGDVRTGVLERDPEPPTAHNPSLPDSLDAVLAKALAKRKLCRYETAAQFRAELQRVCERSGYRIDA